MKWLLWREYRFNRQLLIAGAVLLLLPYFIALIAILWPTEEKSSPYEVAQSFVMVAFVSCGLSQLTVAFLSGNAIAGECADRSAEFMAYLPVSRERRLASKLILLFDVATIIWSINLLVIWGLRLSWDIPYHPEFQDVFLFMAITGFAMFGVGWLVSSLQSSPTFAVCGGLAAPFVVLMGLYLTGYILERNLSSEVFSLKTYNRFVTTGYISINLVLGAIGFAVGTWYFLKRVEP